MLPEKQAGGGGVRAPAGTPAGISTKLHGRIATSLRAPAVRTPLVESSHDVVGSTPDEFATAIRNDLKLWGDLARKLDVKVD